MIKNNPVLPMSQTGRRRASLASSNSSIGARKKVGGYVLGEVIGKGSFAKVRIGTHLLTQEKVSCCIGTFCKGLRNIFLIT